MNESQIAFVTTGAAPSQTDKLISLLHEAEGAWVSLLTLEAATGSHCVHSRAADARKLGVNIENRVEFSPITKKRHSFYRLIAP